MNNEYDDEWNVLQSKAKEYTTIPETNGWEIFTFDDNLITIIPGQLQQYEFN